MRLPRNFFDRLYSVHIHLLISLIDIMLLKNKLSSAIKNEEPNLTNEVLTKNAKSCCLNAKLSVERQTVAPLLGQ